MTGEVRWGLLGAGWIAREAIVPAMNAAIGARLSAVGSREFARAEALQPQEYASDEYSRIIEDPAVDAIYIALDNAGHEPWAIAAMEAGKPVLCEKPLGMDPRATQRMRDAEKSLGGLLVEATWNLWHPRTRRAMELVGSGAIGSVASVRGSFTFDGVPEGNYRLDRARGGGAMLDVGCYPLTAAAWATGAPELFLGETQVRRGDTGVDLTVECSFGYSRESVPGRILVLASFALPEQQTLRIDGEAGRIDFVGLDAFTSHNAPSALLIGDGEDDVVEEFDPVDPYQAMIESVSNVVRGEEAWLPERDWSLWVADAMAMATSR